MDYYTESLKKFKIGDKIFADISIPSNNDKGWEYAARRMSGKILEKDGMGCLIEFDENIQDIVGIQWSVDRRDLKDENLRGKSGHCYSVIVDDIYK